MKFHEKLKALRKAAGLTLEEVGRRAGITKGGLHALESGKTAYPRAQNIQALADIYGATMDFIMDESRDLTVSVPDSGIILLREFEKLPKADQIKVRELIDVWNTNNREGAVPMVVNGLPEGFAGITSIPQIRHAQEMLFRRAAMEESVRNTGEAMERQTTVRWQPIGSGIARFAVMLERDAHQRGQITALEDLLEQERTDAAQVARERDELAQHVIDLLEALKDMITRFEFLAERAEGFDDAPSEFLSTDKAKLAVAKATGKEVE